MDFEKIKEQKQFFIDKFEKEGFEEQENLVAEIKFTREEKGSPIARIDPKLKTIALNFINQNSGIKIKITEDKIIFTESEYNGFDRMKNVLISSIKILSEKLRNREIQKVNLRKIDVITIHPVDDYKKVLEHFNPALFGILKSDIIKSNSVKALDDMIVLEDGNRTCVLGQRFIKIKDKECQAELDFDLVHEEKITSYKALEQVLESLNQIHFDLFLWSINQEKMLPVLNGEQ